MPFWGFLFCKYTQPASSGMYALADIYREELDVPIPDCPHTGYVPRRELPQPLVSRPSIDVSDEQCEPDYYADDEMSITHRAVPFDYGTDATNATVREERRGASEQLAEDRSALSNFSYYYYHDPDYEQPAQVLRMSSFVLRSMLKIIEETPLTQAESWFRCKGWRYQTARATGVTQRAHLIEATETQIDADAHTPPPFSIFQILHDQPVAAVDKMQAVTEWRGAVAPGSFGSMPSAPPSLISFLARRRSSLASCAKAQSLDPEIDSAMIGVHINSTAHGDQKTKCLTVIDDVDEPNSEHPLVAEPCEQVLELAAVEVVPDAAEQCAPPAFQHDTSDGACMVKASVETLLPALDDKAVPEPLVVCHTIDTDLIAPEHADEKMAIKLTHFTPQMVRSMINVLTTPSTDMQQLKVFWEGQR